MNYFKKIKVYRPYLLFLGAGFIFTPLLYSCHHTEFSAVNASEAIQEIPTAPKEIGINIFASRQIRIDGNFDIKKALIHLFPGNSVKLETSTTSIQVVNWRCSNCKPRHFEGMSSPEDEIFPAHEGMITRFRDKLEFEQNGKSYTLLTLTSGYYTPNQALMGRMSCSFLGLALFEKSGNGWDLKTFNPAIVCLGNFFNTPSPTLQKIGKNNAFAFDYYIGGKDTPKTCDRLLVGLIKGEFQPLYQQDFFKRQDGELSNWDAKIIVQNDSNQFANLEVVTTGKISKVDLDEWDIEYLPKSLQDKLQIRDDFRFELHQYLQFEKKKYQIKSDTLIITEVEN